MVLTRPQANIKIVPERRRKIEHCELWPWLKTTCSWPQSRRPSDTWAERLVRWIHESSLIYRYWILFFPKLLNVGSINYKLAAQKAYSFLGMQDRCLPPPTPSLSSPFSPPLLTNFNTSIVNCGSNLRPVFPLYFVKRYLHLIWNNTVVLIPHKLC